MLEINHSLEKLAILSHGEIIFLVKNPLKGHPAFYKRVYSYELEEIYQFKDLKNQHILEACPTNDFVKNLQHLLKKA